MEKEAAEMVEELGEASGEEGENGDVEEAEDKERRDKKKLIKTARQAIKERGEMLGGDVMKMGTRSSRRDHVTHEP